MPSHYYPASFVPLWSSVPLTADFMLINEAGSLPPWPKSLTGILEQPCNEIFRLCSFQSTIWIKYSIFTSSIYITQPLNLGTSPPFENSNISFSLKPFLFVPPCFFNMPQLHHCCISQSSESECLSELLCRFGSVKQFGPIFDFHRLQWEKLILYCTTRTTVVFYCSRPCIKILRIVLLVPRSWNWCWIITLA